MKFHRPPDKVWNGILFYEEITEPTPAVLRWVIPRALKTEGPKSRVGDQVHCYYESGFLRKELTEIVPGELFSFSVTEQNLNLHGAILLGGEYRLRAIPGCGTEVSLMTRYHSPKQPRWLWRRLEAVVCHAFHRHILRALRTSLAGAKPGAERGGK